MKYLCRYLSALVFWVNGWYCIRIDSECEIKLKIVYSKFYLILHVFQKFTKYFKNEKLTNTVEISLN